MSEGIDSEDDDEAERSTDRSHGRSHPFNYVPAKALSLIHGMREHSVAEFASEMIRT